MREHIAYFTSHADLAVVVDAIDLGDQRRLHRRSRRHLDDLDAGLVTGANFLQRPAQRQRDLVAVALTQRLVAQVDLDIGQVGGVAQVILPHQAVEIDRRRAAHVSLVVGHLGHFGKIVAEFGDHARAAFEAGTLGHVDDHLYLRLVVERQHFQHHQLEPGETDRGQDQRDDRDQQQPAVAAAAAARQQRRDDAAEQRVQRLVRVLAAVLRR